MLKTFSYYYRFTVLLKLSVGISILCIFFRNVLYFQVKVWKSAYFVILTIQIAQDDLRRNII